MKTLIALAWLAAVCSMCFLSGCAMVGKYQDRPGGAQCREVRPLMGLGKQYSECRMRINGRGAVDLDRVLGGSQ